MTFQKYLKSVSRFQARLDQGYYNSGTGELVEERKNGDGDKVPEIKIFERKHCKINTCTCSTFFHVFTFILPVLRYILFPLFEKKI